METWFEVWMDRIQPVRIDKHTDACVWVGGQRRNRWSWRSYFPTWDEAHQYLLNTAQQDLNAAKVAFHIQRSRYGIIKAMRAPETEGSSL